MPTYGDNTTSNSRYFQKGVFIDKAKIISVEDCSNYPQREGAEIKTVGKKGTWKPELCLKLKIDSGIEMDMIISGWFNWQQDAISGKKLKYRGWSKRKNAVQNLIFKLLGKFDTDDKDDSIPPELLNRLIGLEFYKLRYCLKESKGVRDDGSPQQQGWWIFEKGIEGNDDILYKEWLKAIPKDYDPNFWEDYNKKRQADTESFDPSKLDTPGEDVFS